MRQRVGDVMTMDPVTLGAGATAVEAARAMKSYGIGDVVVLDRNGNLGGIVTDRDIAIRVVAEGNPPEQIRLADFCSRALVTVAPGDDVNQAISLMREQALRRLPVVESGKVVGILTLGDLALERDPDSALADISTAPANL
jgi:signal-transduction protein with cAMP-binding, CBS, and nucleotidyltransferase domain